MDKFPTLEEWGKSTTSGEEEDRILTGWAFTISQMSELDSQGVLDHIARTFPVIHQRIQKILNKGVTNERI